MKIATILSVLLFTSSHLPAAVEVTASLPDYKPSAPSYTLTGEKITGNIGEELQSNRYLIYRYPIEWDSDQTPTKFAEEDLGVRLSLTVHRDGNKLFYSGQLSLSKLARPKDPTAAILKAITPLKGVVESGSLIKISTKAPDGKKISLHLKINEV